MPKPSDTPFTRTFLADDLTLRRAVNVLIKNRVQFACVPRTTKNWTLSLGDKGALLLQEEGITG